MLGPLPCNGKYNGVLLLPIAEETTLSGFADDLAIVIIAKVPEDMEVYATEAGMAIRSWLEGAELSLAEEKTEAILVTNR